MELTNASDNFRLKSVHFEHESIAVAEQHKQLN